MWQGEWWIGCSSWVVILRPVFFVPVLLNLKISPQNLGFSSPGKWQLYRLCSEPQPACLGRCSYQFSGVTTGPSDPAMRGIPRSYGGPVHKGSWNVNVTKYASQNQNHRQMCSFKLQMRQNPFSDWEGRTGGAYDAPLYLLVVWGGDTPSSYPSPSTPSASWSCIDALGASVLSLGPTNKKFWINQFC